MVDKYGKAHEKQKKTITDKTKTTPTKGTAKIKEYSQKKNESKDDTKERAHRFEKEGDNRNTHYDEQKER